MQWVKGEGIRQSKANETVGDVGVAMRRRRRRRRSDEAFTGALFLRSVERNKKSIKRACGFLGFVGDSGGVVTADVWISSGRGVSPLNKA